MDASDWILLGAAGFGGWWLYNRSKQVPQPTADVNGAGASSMVSGAAAQTQAGFGSIAGLFGGTTFPFPRLPAPTPTKAAGAQFQDAVRRLLQINILRRPVANVPVVVSSVAAGLLPTPGLQPPPEVFGPNIISSSGLRGVL